MFDARITEIATGQVKNYFDVDNEWTRMMKSALHPDLFTIEGWPVLTYHEERSACTDNEPYNYQKQNDSDNHTKPFIKHFSPPL